MTRTKRIREDNPFQLLLVNYMKKNKLRVKDAAKILNTYPVNISRITSGQHIPLMNSFCNIISKMGLSPRQIYYFMEDMAKYYDSNITDKCKEILEKG